MNQTEQSSSAPTLLALPCLAMPSYKISFSWLHNCITHQCPEDLRHIERELAWSTKSLHGPQWFLLPQPQKKRQAESSGAQFRWDQSLNKTSGFDWLPWTTSHRWSNGDILLWGTLGKEVLSRSQFRETNPNDFTSKGKDIHPVSWELEALLCSSEVERLPSV